MFDGEGTNQGDGAGGEGGQQQQQPGSGGDWREHVPAEYRDAPALRDVKDIGSLAKQFVDQQRFLGNAIRIPGDDSGEMGRKEFLEKLQKHAPELIRRPDPSDDKAMAEFWALAGVPQESAGYEIDEGVQADEAWLANVKEQARKYGLTKGAFRKFVSDQVQERLAEEARTKEIMTADFASLQQEWGMATEARVNDVKKFAEVMNLPQGFRDALSSGRVGSEWIRAIHGIIQQFGGISEGKQVAFQPGGAVPDSPDEIRAKIREIEQHEGFSRMNHPDHSRLIAKRVELFGQLDNAKSSN